MLQGCIEPSGAQAAGRGWVVLQSWFRSAGKAQHHRRAVVSALGWVVRAFKGAAHGEVEQHLCHCLAAAGWLITVGKNDVNA